MNEVVVGGGVMGAAFTQVATELSRFKVDEVFSAIANFAPLWLVLIPLGIGLMLLRRVLTGARKGKAKI